MRVQPKFKIGDTVKYTTKMIYEPAKQMVEVEIVGLIGSIHTDSTDKDYTYKYGIYKDLSAPYHNGTYIESIMEDKLTLIKKTIIKDAT